MRWEKFDVDRFLNHRDLIDTALIPLIEIDLHSVEESVRRGAWTTGVAHQIEEELAGRILLLPVLTYTENHSIEERLNYINHYASSLRQHHIQHPIFITAESWLSDHEKLHHATVLYLELSEEATDYPTASQLFDIAQKYLTQLIKLWQKG